MSDWLESVRRLMNELSAQPIETQQSMQELSRKSYPNETRNSSSTQRK